MLGHNLFNWCHSWGPYAESPENAHTDGRPHLLMGGAFFPTGATGTKLAPGECPVSRRGHSDLPPRHTPKELVNISEQR